MLLIHHKGIHISVNLDTTSFNGDTDHDSSLPYIVALKGGVVVGLNSSGFAQLADGATGSAIRPLGFNVNDAAGYFMQNKPAIASKELGITFSPCVISTDKFVVGTPYTPGQKLYCGTAGNVGLVTNVAPDATARPIGLALNDASSGGTVDTGSLSIAPGVPMLKIAVGSIAD